MAVEDPCCVSGEGHFGDLGGKGKIPMMILLMAEIRPSPVDMVD